MASRVRGSILLVLVNSLSVLCRPHVPVNENMHSFSSAIKGGHLVPGEEYLLYESDTGEPGVITEQWFTGDCDFSIVVVCLNLLSVCLARASQTSTQSRKMV